MTPIVAGQAVKGPAGKIMTERGLAVSPATIARHYAGLIDGFVLDQADIARKEEIEVPVCMADTLMHTLDDKVALATAVCAFASELQAGLPRRESA